MTGSLPQTNDLYGEISRLLETFTEQGDLDAAAKCIDTCTELVARHHTDVCRYIITSRICCLYDT
jgi:hypothetical protein